MQWLEWAFLCLCKLLGYGKLTQKKTVKIRVFVYLL